MVEEHLNSVELKQYEKIEPLDNGYAIIQSERGYRFGSDAVALYKFARRFVKADARVLDLCSGSGVIGIMLAADKGCSVDGVEIDKELWDMSVRSCALNELCNVCFYNADIREPELPLGVYDAIVCNPPFYKKNSKPSAIAPNANSELTVCFEDIAAACKAHLKVGGSLCIVHTATRLDEIMVTLRAHSLMPKELVINGSGKTFLLRAVRGGKAGMTVSMSGQEEI